MTRPQTQAIAARATKIVESATVAMRHLYLSRGHNFFGHHGKAVGDHPMEESACLFCLAGRGILGDRFFDYKEDYKGQITFFSHEIFMRLRRGVGAPGCAPSALRRNVVIEGVDLNQLIGRTFEIQGLLLEGTEECHPCYWMDQAVAPGAEKFLKGNGGLRARILNDGWLRPGRADLMLMAT